jgi:hypothetical protein
MFLACQKSKVTIKLKFYYSDLKNAVETVKIAVDHCRRLISGKFEAWNGDTYQMLAPKLTKAAKLSRVKA